jgi:hypothetical protein
MVLRRYVLSSSSSLVIFEMKTKLKYGDKYDLSRLGLTVCRISDNNPVVFDLL